MDRFLIQEGTDKMADNKPVRRCVCNECPHGPATKVKRVDFSTEVYCTVGMVEADGRIAPAMVGPVMKNSDQGPRDCSRYQRFEARRRELIEAAEPAARQLRVALG